MTYEKYLNQKISFTNCRFLYTHESLKYTTLSRYPMFYLRDKNNQIVASAETPFSQGNCISPILRLYLGDYLVCWEKISYSQLNYSFSQTPISFGNYLSSASSPFSTIMVIVASIIMIWVSSNMFHIPQTRYASIYLHCKSACPLSNPCASKKGAYV